MNQPRVEADHRADSTGVGRWLAITAGLVALISFGPTLLGLVLFSGLFALAFKVALVLILIANSSVARQRPLSVKTAP